MSVDQAAAAVLSQIALAGDGAVVGLALAYVAVRSILKFWASYSALRKIHDAPSVRVSDLRSILSHSKHSDGGKIVVVRGYIKAKSVVEGYLMSLRATNALVSPESGEKGVVLLQTRTCIYNEWRGFFGWTSDIRSLFARLWKEKESSSLRTVPFILVDGRIWPFSGYVVVNMDGSRHPIPLVTVYHHLQPITASPYSFLQALFSHEHPVGLLDEEKILPLGKDVTAVGTCRLKNGTPEIKSCKDLPYFMSDMTKEQMLVDLAFRTKVLLWSGVVLSSLAIGVLGYAAVRNWNRWKEWTQVRRVRQDNTGTSSEPLWRRVQRDNTATSSEVAAEVVADEETGDIPDEQLCVICLRRKRTSAFVPCGHLVCCQQCALLVERQVSSKCPVCRQSIQTSMRIYDS